ncbi:acyl-CoA dehydrogenase [Desulfosporosinus orientis DSM 765]|uniref:Acyl-CoA dehydrogenase n=1 Tax=Desulfosporosinus orientis (strain ATCC 19365 / DSM 765 / NCIMB 8382 / VKM B-1628 / Singapore I) TaxID=768706 RepID=G7WCX1_DESOD|nr:acyl-CoA dehydrogenase family protein [Desulfosporosinus orientis]AET66877.1 acyl-CoA dehydrogenase [Desulfosporosinus orientis DSM 765]
MKNNNVDIVAKTKQFCKEYLKPIAKELDKNYRFPTELLGLMKKEGFWGINQPVEYGGGGYDNVQACKVIEEIAKVSAGVAMSIHGHWSVTDALVKFGTDSQKKKYFPSLLNGEKIAAFCVSEIQAGSDAASITSTAVKHGDGWLINGPKWFCTNGGLADIYLLAFKTDPQAGSKGISLFIVEKGTAGFDIGEPQEKMGCRSSVITGLTFKNCLIPAENIIGNVNGGFKLIMHALNSGRLEMAAMGLGIAKASFAEAKKYANRRVAFGKPLTALYSIQEMLSDMYVKIQAAKLIVEDAARKRDSGDNYSLESSVAKLFVAQVVNEVCYKALQVFGGHGYMQYNNIERYARDGRVMDIGVGTTEVLKMVVGNVVSKIKDVD